MCGICGFWAPDVDDPTKLLGEMTDALSHRGPDGSGRWIQGGIALGHRRLSILDLSTHGTQPMVSRDQRWVVTFNGEIYNFRQIRSCLKGPFTSESDTEVLVEAIARWGVHEAVCQLNGMFAFAAYDTESRRLYLVRDRLGIKPLFYAHFGRSVVFGSELKALRPFPDLNPTLDRDALAQYVRYNYVPTPSSIFNEVEKLPAGTIWSVDEDGRTTTLRYWDPITRANEVANAHQVGDHETVELVEHHLKASIKRRMISDVPLGAFLSGGIDSSSIVALMQSQSSSPVKTFTIGFDDGSYDEAKWAKKIAAHLGTEHTELILSPDDALAVIPKLPELYDEPFADSSQIPTHLVCKLARRHVTVALSGDGADELLGGYNRHLWAPRISKLGLVPRAVRKRLAAALSAVSNERWERALGAIDLPVRLPAEKLQKFANVLPKESMEIYAGLRTHWDNPAALVLGSTDSAIQQLRAKSGRIVTPSMAERMMLLDLTTYLPDDILCKVDRASMGVGLEARVPFLDHTFVELAWSLPSQMKIRNGTTKWALRQVLKKHVHPAMFERPKMGFGIPIGSWLRGPLNDWAESLLDETLLRQEGIFDSKRVRKAWNEHLAGTRNWQHHLWDILMFQAWNQRWKTT